MKLILKGIRGGSCTIDAQESTTILEIKQKAESDLNIPVSQQTLVLFGKTLQDNKTVGFYSKIKDGTKLHVAVKKPETLNSALTRYLQQYYSDQQCEKIMEEFMKDFYMKVNNLSLDDLERFALADTALINST